MNCHEAMALLPTFSDGELDAVQSAALEKHILGCADCSAQRDALSALRLRIRSETPYYTAPATLQARIRATIARAPRAAGAAVRPHRRALALAFRRRARRQRGDGVRVVPG